MKTILIPTDFSDNALNAVKFALNFFKHDKAEFYFMHAYQSEVYNHDDLGSREDFIDLLAKIKKQSETDLDSLLYTVNKIAPNPKYKYHTISSYNTLVEEAELIADSKNIDLIVMGTKGKSNEKHKIFGSNTLQVLKYVHCPVLTIPENYTNTQPKRALFPTNYLIPYKRRELKLLSDLLAPYRCKIEVVYFSKAKHLSYRQEDNMQFIKEIIDKNEIEFKIIEDNNLDKAIQNYITDHQIDLLVMVNSRHSFLEDMLFQSTLDKVCLNNHIPLLAMQNTLRNPLTTKK